MFKILSLRRSLSLGKEPKGPDEADRTRRQRIIDAQRKEGLAIVDGRTKLQDAKQKRDAHLKQIKDVEAIRNRFAALYADRRKDAYKKYEKTLPPKRELQEGVAKQGLLKKASAFLFGTKPTAVQIEKDEAFSPPNIDKDFLSELGKSLSKRQRKILNSVKKDLDAVNPPAVGDGIRSYQESLDANLGQMLQEWRDKADNACREIHVWEDEVRRPDTKTLPVEATGEDRPSVKAIGWGELIVARERLIGYDVREVAHIENVLPGEERLREHKSTTTREVVNETETKEETRTQKNLETTDRFELETQSQKVINAEMKLDAGVNTSGKYGLTTVETSLEAGLSRTQEESHSTTSKLAREIVSRTVQDINKSTRELRRVTVTEKVEELNSHRLSRQGKDTGYSGIYYWVEKIHEIDLRHYGTRLMVEFFIPEPALSLLPQNALSTQSFRKPAPLTIGPTDIGEDNYRCLAALYGAVDVEPPPAAEIQIGYAWASTPNESGNKNCQETKLDKIPIPNPGWYKPTQVWGAVTGYASTWAGNQEIATIDVFLAIGGVGVELGQTDPNFGPIDVQHAVVAPDGLPLTIRASFIYDQTCTVNVKVLCELTAAGLQVWQLKTFERIKEAHATLMADYQRQVARAEIQGGIEIKGRPPAENRAREIEELTKWAIKTMRIDPFRFDAVAVQEQQEEIDPVLSDAYAPVICFFQDAFEWRQMSYMLFPYYWGRRNSYGYRNTLTDADPLHQAFLRAGAARVIVPVTPGFEERILYYLDNKTLPEIQRVNWFPAETAVEDAADDLWLEVITSKQEDMVRGSGTLNVTYGSKTVSVNSDSKWIPNQRDIGRELIIRGDVYTIKELCGENVANGDGNKCRFTIEPAYKSKSDESAIYATGSVRVGEPWTVHVPTSLVILAEEAKRLWKNIDDKIPLNAMGVD